MTDVLPGQRVFVGGGVQAYGHFIRYGTMGFIGPQMAVVELDDGNAVSITPNLLEPLGKDAEQTKRLIQAAGATI